MSKLFWYKICPVCNEGRLFVFKNVDTDNLYLHCEECEAGYKNIDSIDVAHSFLTLLEDFHAVSATENDLRKFGWENLNFTIIDE